MTEPLRVLVVDDDPDVRDLLDDYLSGQGYEVLTADSAAAARELLDGEAPNVVLLDVGLPGEDGLSLARHIRERFDIGIIMISGAGETVDRIVGLEVGADDYVANDHVGSPTPRNMKDTARETAEKGRSSDLEIRSRPLT